VYKPGAGLPEGPPPPPACEEAPPCDGLTFADEYAPAVALVLELVWETGTHPAPSNTMNSFMASTITDTNRFSLTGAAGWYRVLNLQEEP